MSEPIVQERPAPPPHPSVPVPENRTDAGRPHPDPPASPEAFYQRIVPRPEIRDHLRRLAQR